METKTFVFFDLETTGLESGTRITEISLVAASRDHIIDKHNGVTKENIIGEDFLPRVLNKVNLTVYPCRMIHPRASEITGKNKSVELIANHTNKDFASGFPYTIGDSELFGRRQYSRNYDFHGPLARMMRIGNRHCGGLDLFHDGVSTIRRGVLTAAQQDST
ncbi:exodeoxyribonuclease III activity protein [Homalodisca vitripennis]|nr:exodeoxyribonuclease III activity protein [Homalodisca vitripennis]